MRESTFNVSWRRGAFNVFFLFKVCVCVCIRGIIFSSKCFAVSSCPPCHINCTSPNVTECRDSTYRGHRQGTQVFTRHFPINEHELKLLFLNKVETIWNTHIFIPHPPPKKSTNQSTITQNKSQLGTATPIG